jgi:hypothetical protein
MTFPLLRIFYIVTSTRRLVFTLLSLVPNFAAIIVVLMVVFFIYAVIGVWILAGRYGEVLQDQAPRANFDSVGNGLLTLFQMLVGESWHELMYAAIRARNGFAISYFFISFILVVSLLFTNVFIGVILDAFERVFSKIQGPARKPARKAANGGGGGAAAAPGTPLMRNRTAMSVGATPLAHSRSFSGQSMAR